MNANKYKRTHTDTDESLEAFRPFPAYQSMKPQKQKHWYQFFKSFIKNKH